MEDEVNLIDYIKVIIKQRYTILGVMVVGMVIALCSHLTTPKVYQATGYYKTAKGFFSNPDTKHIVAEAKIKYPFTDITILKNTHIIFIKTTGTTLQEAKNKCIKIAKALPIKKIVDVSSKPLKQKRMEIVLTILSFIFLGIFVGFVKEWWGKWWGKNKGEICGK